MPQQMQFVPIERLRAAVEPGRLTLPQEPAVQEVRVEEYEDSAGEPALSVYVVLSDDVPEDAALWPLVRPIYRGVRAAIESTGDTRYAYISAGTRSDLAARGEPDPDLDGEGPA